MYSQSTSLPPTGIAPPNINVDSSAPLTINRAGSSSSMQMRGERMATPTSHLPRLPQLIPSLRAATPKPASPLGSRGVPGSIGGGMPASPLGSRSVPGSSGGGVGAVVAAGGRLPSPSSSSGYYSSSRSVLAYFPVSAPTPTAAASTSTSSSGLPLPPSPLTPARAPPLHRFIASTGGNAEAGLRVVAAAAVGAGVKGAAVVPVGVRVSVPLLPAMATTYSLAKMRGGGGSSLDQSM